MTVAAYDDQTADSGIDQKSEGRKAGVRGPISKGQLNDGEPEPGQDEKGEQGPTAKRLGRADASVDSGTGSTLLILTGERYESATGIMIRRGLIHRPTRRT